jgi:hypothetical protein
MCEVCKWQVWQWKALILTSGTDVLLVSLDKDFCMKQSLLLVSYVYAQTQQNLILAHFILTETF